MKRKSLAYASTRAAKPRSLRLELENFVSDTRSRLASLSESIATQADRRLVIPPSDDSAYGIADPTLLADRLSRSTAKQVSNANPLERIREVKHGLSRQIENA